jgi:hypothetical protein
MGRHSAPDEDPDEASAAGVVLEKPPLGGPRGRHSREEDLEDTGPVPGVELRKADERAAAQDERPTQRIALDELLLGEPSPPTGAPPENGAAKAEKKAEKEAAKQDAREKKEREKAARGSQSTAADLALIRRHPEVRNRVLGAVLVPFVIYVAALLVVGAGGVHYLLWIWIPMVSAGVLAGLVLDSAHRRLGPVEEGSTEEAGIEADEGNAGQ